VISLEEVFATGGPLAAVRGGLEPRPGQLAMAQRIERGMLESVHTLVEAGTGVGKSYGYLIPALRSGKRVVISTGTVALQERLVESDIPTVARALGLEPRVVLLKGRNHYLCRDKFERQNNGALLAPTQTLDALWNWAYETVSGDRAELPFVPPAAEWESLDANADDCLAEHCAEFARCHYFKARASAREAQIIVVNHALFFLDLAIGGLLPQYDHVILDEAHQCEHWATAALTGVVSDRTVGRVLRRLRTTYSLPAEHEASAESALRALESVVIKAPQDRTALVWDHEDPLTSNTSSRLAELRSALRRVEVWLESEGHKNFRRTRLGDDETDRRLELSVREVRTLISTIELALKPPAESVAWIERNETVGAVHTAPYDVAPFLRERFFGRVESVTLTSATLAENGSFEFLKRALGIDRAQELVVDSPYNYARQARLFVAPADVNPKSMNFVQRALPILEQTLLHSRGRAFVLFTSHARMKAMFHALRSKLPFPVRIQGEHHPAALLRWFAQTPNAVLFATGAFWEGIDVAGEALSCVVIDRLPFPSPGDPLVAARLASIEAAGEDSFKSYMVPAAIARLKQGFGRLIRSASDRGVLVLLDGRAGSTGFGRNILAALPSAQRIQALSELDAFFG
jgi:ATP-dependent DNA helicase DinG